MHTAIDDRISKTSRWLTWVSAFCLCGLLFGACSEVSTTPTRETRLELDEWIQEELAPNEVVVATLRSSFDITHREVIRIKILDTSTGQIREIVFDVVDGKENKYEELLSESVLSWREQFGSASPEMVRQLEAQLPGGYLVDVEVAPNNDLEDSLEALKSLEVDVISVHRRIVTARSNADQVHSIAELEFVSVVTPHHERENLSIDAAQDLGQPALAVSHSLGVGADWLIAIWELETCVFHGHPDFSKIAWVRSSDCDLTNQLGHSTQVAGVLGARREEGAVGLFRARFLEVDSMDQAAEDEMWRLSPVIVNTSFTISPFDGKDIDREVYEQGIFVFNGSGNEPEDRANCYAYNALCVGGYFHQGTISQYDDDIMAGSSYLNDRNNGREYPDILGPYVVRTASNNGGYSAGSGTSFATPAVAGLGGLLLTSYPFELWQKPALMRAVLMASAQAHPVIDDGRLIPDISDAIDDRMGVGAPDGLRAKNIMEEASYVYKRITPATLGLQTNFEVEANERVRVVLAWDQCPGYAPFDPGGAQLFADLDMAVLAPSRLVAPSLLAGSEMVAYTNVSFVDNQEIVEFISEAAGMVSVFVSADRFAPCASEGNITVAPMAIVWTKEPAPPVFTED